MTFQHFSLPTVIAMTSQSNVSNQHRIDFFFSSVINIFAYLIDSHFPFRFIFCFVSRLFVVNRIVRIILLFGFGFNVLLRLAIQMPLRQQTTTTYNIRLNAPSMHWLHLHSINFVVVVCVSKKPHTLQALFFPLWSLRHHYTHWGCNAAAAFQFNFLSLFSYSSLCSISLYFERIIKKFEWPHPGPARSHGAFYMNTLCWYALINGNVLSGRKHTNILAGWNTSSHTEWRR